MKTTQIKYAWLRLTLLAALFAAAILALSPTRSALADDPDGDVLISSDGEETVAVDTAATFSASYSGTGVMAENQTAINARNAVPLKGTESVIGADGRTRLTNTTDYPNRAIASLIFTFDGSSYFLCTGWFIGPNTLATAGHCVFDTEQYFKFATEMYVYAGRNGNVAPYGEAIGTKLFTTKCWKTTASPDCDYGVIRINSNLGNNVGWFGFAAFDTNTLLKHKVSVRGYPGDKPDGTLWTMRGKIKQVTNKSLGYPIDTFGGQSGSPIFGEFSSLPACNPCSVGVHAYGVGVPPFATNNSGARITQKVFKNLCKWRGGC